VVWFYLTWIDPRVKGQIAENAAKLANETSGFKCESPCQSNQKAVAGGCCDGEDAGNVSSSVSRDSSSMLFLSKLSVAAAHPTPSTLTWY
jgi:hypothetical protein